MAAKKNTQTTPVNFEQSLSELESIVSAMEDNELPLEQLVAQYEKGIKLLNLCEGVLKQAKTRLKTISEREIRGNHDSDTDCLDEDHEMPEDAPATRRATDDDDDDIRLF
jgi:exodeoxyribonuclease VII small subunit